MSFDEEEVWKKLTTHRVIITQKLRVDRSLLFDYLRSKLVLDSEDCQLVRAEKTNERKAGKLLDVLLTKGKDGLVHFLDVLQLINPALYEKLAGVKATTRLNPIFTDVSDKCLSDIDPGRDLDILSNHLKRAVTDLQEMTLRYDQVLKENQQLAKCLSHVTSDLDLRNKQLGSLEEEVKEAQKREKQAKCDAEKIEQSATQQMQEYHQTINDQNVHIIILQMKLLSSEEESNRLRSKIEKSTHTNQEVIFKLKDLSQKFDNERRQSISLSERLANQRRSIQEVEDLRNTYLELQLSTQELRMERDQALAELVELKSWTEALMAKYDIVEKNTKRCKENYEQAMAGCSLFYKQIEDLKFQLSIFKRQEQSLKSRNEELNRLLSRFREQRDVYDEARKEAIKERDEARNERDEIFQQYNDALKGRDEALRRHAQDCKEFEERREAADSELWALMEKLALTEEELRRCKVDGDMSINIKSFMAISNPTNTSATEEEISIKQPLTESINDKHGHKPKDSNIHKSCADIINSVRRRFTKNSNSSFSDNNDTTVMDLASSFSRLPFQTLTPMLCPAAIHPMSPGSPSSEISIDKFGFGTFFLSKSDDSIVRPLLSDVQGETGETKDAGVLPAPLLHRNCQCPTPTLVTRAMHDMESGVLSTNNQSGENDSGKEELYELTSTGSLMYRKVHKNLALERCSSGPKEHDMETHEFTVKSQSESDVIGDASPIPGQGLQRLYAFRRPRRV